MRVPQSPKSLRRVTTLSSVRNDDNDDEGASSGSDEGNNRECKKTTSTAANDDKPPRPTYTARIKDGKYTVGVEASLSSTSTFTSGNDNTVTTDNNDPSKSGAHLFNRGRDRTRISAVQRLVERKLAQKEKERLKERELERDRVMTSSNFDWKYRSSSTSSNFARDRNCNSIGSSDDNDKGEFEKKIRNENENEYLASLLWRTSRSCSGTRRRCGLNEEEDVAKTIITIGPGKPTRIREHSPSKKSPTTEQPPTTFENLNEEKEPGNKVRPPPRDPSPSKVSDSLYMNSAPLKSTGLFREFTKTTTTTTSSTGGGSTRTGNEKRKTSFTTEKTIHLSGEHDKEKARRLSIDCNFVFVKSPTTYSTFTQSERLVSASSTSSLSSNSFSSTSSHDSTGEKEPIRLSRLRTANFESGDNSKDKNPDFTPDPPIRERKTSRRIFIHTPYHNLNNTNSNNKNNDSCGDDTSSNVSSTDEGSINGNDNFGETYMSASSRLLYNLSSGYRQHRAAAAANRSVNINIIRTSTTTANNNSNNNKSFNTNEDSYPRRRFSQEHLVLQEEDSDTFGESVSIKRPIRQPVRKISLPVRPTRESTGMRHEVSRSDTCFHYPNPMVKDSNRKNNGDGHNTFKDSLGEGPTLKSTPWSKFKICDDSLFYPGCCAHHDRRSLENKQSGFIRNRFPSRPFSNSESYFLSSNTPLTFHKTNLSFESHKCAMDNDVSVAGVDNDDDDDVADNRDSHSVSGMDFFRNFFHKFHHDILLDSGDLTKHSGSTDPKSIRSGSRAHSENTLGDLIDETFDTEDSELKQLDWDDLSIGQGSDIFNDEDEEEDPLTPKQPENDLSYARPNVHNIEDKLALIQRVKDLEPVRRLLLSGTRCVPDIPNCQGFRPIRTVSQSRVKMFTDLTKRAAEWSMSMQ